MMGLSPDVFWNMTLSEWRAALAGYAQSRGLRMGRAEHALPRAEFLRLLQLYPDTRL
jgi:hypothetical protein